MEDILIRLQREQKREPHEPIWRDAGLEIERLRADVARLNEETDRSDKTTNE